MMAVDAIKQIDRHAEKASCFSLIDASLYQPHCGCMAQSMRRDFAVETSEHHSAFEGRLDRFNRFAIPLYQVAPNQTLGFPTLQMCQQARRDGNWRLPLLGLSFALCESIKDTIIEIDVRPAFAALVRQCYRARKATLKATFMCWLTARGGVVTIVA